MRFDSGIGVGVSDLQHAMRAELARIFDETKGDPLAQCRLLVQKVRDLGLITDKETAAVVQLAKIGVESGNGEKPVTAAYFEAREIFNKLLASGNASPVALALGSSAVGSYSINQNPDGTDSVVFAKVGGNWEGRGAAAGAIIGSVWGTDGAAVGAAVGGLIGHAVDECTK